jgi:hypothetical protein
MTECRDQLFQSYVGAMLKWRAARLQYTGQQTIHWLSWLASRLAASNQTVFHLESLAPDWAVRRGEKWLYALGLILSCGLIGGLSGRLSTSLNDRLFGAMVFALIFGVIGLFWEIRPVERVLDLVITRSDGIVRNLGPGHPVWFGPNCR